MPRRSTGERGASDACDRKAQADVQKKIAAKIAVMENGSCPRGMVVRLHEQEERRDKQAGRPSLSPIALREIQANIADICRRRLARPAVTPDLAENRDTAALIMSDPTRRFVLDPSAKRSEMAAAQCADLHTILEWAGGGKGNVGTSAPEISVSVVAGVGFEPTTFRL